MTEISFEFKLHNARKDRLAVSIEPWGEVENIKPGGSLKLRATGPASEDPAQCLTIQLERGDGVSVWAWTGSTISVVPET
jgi:hypothetical protein